MCRCLGIIWLITALCYTNIANNMIIFSKHLRNPVAEESERLNILLKMVISRIYSDPNKIFRQLDNIKFKIIKSQIIDNYVIGKNTISISNGAMDILDDDKLEALIAHRVMCLHLGSGLQSNALKVNVWLFHKITLILNVFKITKTRNSRLIGLLGKILAIILMLFVSILFIVMLPLLVLCWLIDKINLLLIALWIKYSNQCADKKIFNVGYQQQLIELLKTMDKVSSQNGTNFFERYLSGLYSPTSRISVLSKQK